MSVRCKRMWALLLVLALTAGACTSGGDDDTDAAGGGEAAGLELSRDEAEEAADAWLDEWDELDAGTRRSLERTRVVRRAGVTHVRYTQTYHDIPVRGAEVVVHVRDDGTVEGATSSLAEVDAPPKTQEKVDESRAKSIASKTATDPTSGDPSAKVVWLQDGERLRLGWSVNLATETETSRGAWTIWVDAVTGEVADAKQHTYSGHGGAAASAAPSAPPLAQSKGPACRVQKAPGACVFAPDPVLDPDEIPDPDETAGLLTAQPLLGLKDPSGRSLVGEFVNLEPRGFQAVRDDDGKWDGGRGTPGFEAAMAYFWIDRTQRELQRLGFRDLRDEPFPVVAVDPRAPDNAFYSPAEQQIFLGVASKGVNLGEDAAVIIHEYGHAILDEQAPTLGDAAGSYHEAFGDLLAFLITLDVDEGDGACLAAWAFDECLRRLDSGNEFPDDLKNEVHEDGQIYTSAVFDVVNALLEKEDLELDDCAGGDECDEIRDRVLTTLVASNEFLSPTVALPDVAAAYVRANDVLFDGEDEDLLTEAFADHGLDGAGPATVDRDGRRGDGAKVAVSVDVTHPARGELNLLLGVVDADFEEICTTIPLFRGEPDDRAQNIRGVVDVSATDCAEHVPPSPERQWVLLAEDTKRGGTGRIDGFRVLVGGTPFLATGVPEPIADNDPDGTPVLINGGTSEVEAEDEEEIGDDAPAGGEGPTAFIDVTHAHLGDLSIRAGVADAEGNVLCSVPLLDPDPAEEAQGVQGDADLGKCARFYPPSSSQQWFLEVIDTAPDDEGTVDEFRLEGPRGSHRSRPPTAPIPDDDEDGVVLFITS